jgi:hypothetical protein
MLVVIVAAAIPMLEINKYVLALGSSCVVVMFPFYITVMNSKCT